MSTQTTGLGGARIPLLVLPTLQAWLVATGVRPWVPMHCVVPPHWRGMSIALGAAPLGVEGEWEQFGIDCDMARACGIDVPEPTVEQVVDRNCRVVAVVHLAGPAVHWTELRGHRSDVWAGTPWNWRVACVHPLSNPVLTAQCAHLGLGYLDGTAAFAVSMQLRGM